MKEVIGDLAIWMLGWPWTRLILGGVAASFLWRLERIHLARHERTWNELEKLRASVGAIRALQEKELSTPRQDHGAGSFAPGTRTPPLP